MRAAALLLVLAACGSATKEQTASGPSLLSAEEEKAALAQWQGGWLMPFSIGEPGPHGAREVWWIEGTTMRRWNGEVEEELALSFVAPCLARITKASGSWTYQPFGVRDGTLVVDSTIGVKDEHGSIVCTDLNEVYTLDGDGPRYWQRPVGAKAMRPFPAGYDVTDGTRYLWSADEDPHESHTVFLVGGLFVDESPREGAVHFDTYDAAKAALTGS